MITSAIPHNIKPPKGFKSRLVNRLEENVKIRKRSFPEVLTHISNHFSKSNPTAHLLHILHRCNSHISQLSNLLLSFLNSVFDCGPQLIQGFSKLNPLTISILRQLLSIHPRNLSVGSLELFPELCEITFKIRHMSLDILDEVSNAFRFHAYTAIDGVVLLEADGELVQRGAEGFVLLLYVFEERILPLQGLTEFTGEVRVCLLELNGSALVEGLGRVEVILWQEESDII